MFCCHPNADQVVLTWGQTVTRPMCQLTMSEEIETNCRYATSLAIDLGIGFFCIADWKSCPSARGWKGLHVRFQSEKLQVCPGCVCWCMSLLQISKKNTSFHCSLHSVCAYRYTNESRSTIFSTGTVFVYTTEEMAVINKITSLHYWVPKSQLPPEAENPPLYATE